FILRNRRMILMKIRTCTIFLLALFVFTTGALAQRAKSPARVKAPAAKDYFPLRVGDSWKYRMIDGVAEYTLKVLSAEKQADGTMLYLMEKNAGAEIHDWYSKPNGWVLLHREAYVGQEGLEIKYETPKQFLKNPLVAGAEWSWKGKIVTQMEAAEANQVEGLETVKVHAGTFRAMKVISHVSDGDSAVTK